LQKENFSFTSRYVKTKSSFYSYHHPNHYVLITTNATSTHDIKVPIESSFSVNGISIRVR
jgi:hypothetical protein